MFEKNWSFQKKNAFGDQQKCSGIFYYIDRSVLLENTPRVKFIRNYIRDPNGVFSISSLVRILMTSFPALSQSFVQTVGEKWRAIDLSI